MVLSDCTLQNDSILFTCLWLFIDTLALACLLMHLLHEEPCETVKAQEHLTKERVLVDMLCL